MTIDDRAAEALASAVHRPYWADTVQPPEPTPPLSGGGRRVDLVVVGGGFTGLWTALLARTRRPERSVLLLEADRCGGHASGRNGGFCSPSLTHGSANAERRWPREAERLTRLGQENLRGLEADLVRHGIEADFVGDAGRVAVAATPWEAQAMRESVALSSRLGEPARFLSRDVLSDYIRSPQAAAGIRNDDYALVNPMRLVLGLRRACLEAGVEIAEGTPVTAIRRERGGAGAGRAGGGGRRVGGIGRPGAAGGVVVETPAATVRADRVALATNAATPLLRRLRSAFVPVYDYALMTEPLRRDQLEAIGWTGEQGMTSSGNQFLYFRKTVDDRILWGGYDAIYHFGGRRDEGRTHRPASFRRLAIEFQRWFPALQDVRFTHAWGGVIDSTSRFSLTAGAALGGRVAYALGYTGLGVGASRFGARVMLDLLDGHPTELTELEMIRRGPLPFPPEPLRYAGIQLTRRAMAHEDRTGQRTPWLRLLDRLGMGFGS